MGRIVLFPWRLLVTALWWLVWAVDVALDVVRHEKRRRSRPTWAASAPTHRRDRWTS